MNRKQREAAKANYEANSQSRANRKAQQAQQQATREAAIAKALAEKPRRERHGISVLESGVRGTVAKKAPKLLYPPYLAAIDELSKLTPLRPADEWEPRGKGRETMFRSLCEHLLAKFPVPAFLWNAFFDINLNVFKPMACHVAAGGSLYDYVKNHFPVPLTRKMCHDLLQTPSDMTFTKAVRRVQVRAAGGDHRFFQAYMTNRYAQAIGSKEDEAFWQTVIDWFAKITMLNPNEVGPICDYLAYRRRQDPAFSMKGRSALAVIRGMREWHGLLTHEKGVKATIYRTSGFREASFGDYSRRENNVEVKETWHVREILNARDLADEGRRMGHCVYSYSWRIEKGDTSIWTIVMEDGEGPTGRWAMTTVEVRNDLRRIVQARGRFNRQMTTREHQVLTRWANLNNLEISLGGWW